MAPLSILDGSSYPYWNVGYGTTTIRCGDWTLGDKTTSFNRDGIDHEEVNQGNLQGVRAGISKTLSDQCFIL